MQRKPLRCTDLRREDVEQQWQPGDGCVSVLHRTEPANNVACTFHPLADTLPVGCTVKRTGIAASTIRYEILIHQRLRPVLCMTVREAGFLHRDSLSSLRPLQQMHPMRGRCHLEGSGRAYEQLQLLPDLKPTGCVLTTS